MNLKKKVKKFFTFARRNDGFTLVELIVVIAILGILAGVGTVGYSGYIKKANLAADEALLNNLNTAFAVACLENGLDSTQVTAKSITIGDDKAITEADIVVLNPDDKNTAIQNSFEGYYEVGEFKVYTALYYMNGRFKVADAPDLNESQQTALNKFWGSKNLKKLSSEQMLDTVTSLNGAFTGWLSTNPNAPSDLEMIFNLGGDPEAFNKFKTEYGLTDDDFASGSTKATNAVIKLVASGASKLSDNASEIGEKLANGSEPTALMQEYQVDTLTASAIMYGIVTSYAQDERSSNAFKAQYGNGDVGGLGDINTLFDAMVADEKFNEYKADGIQQDLVGFVGAMELLDSYDDTFEIDDSKAYTKDNEEAVKLLVGILGK